MQLRQESRVFLARPLGVPDARAAHPLGAKKPIAKVTHARPRRAPIIRQAIEVRLPLAWRSR